MIGGAEGDRTPDLMTASHALSQLSYGPKRINSLRQSVKEIERMTTFESFLKEQRYIKNVSPHTIAFYEQSFKVSG
jgi:hypothetical protein